ncbi:MAG: ABC transporter ATP-binding protein, partial [Clostridia bacterium]
YNRPLNTFVADFVGNPSINFIEAKGKQNSKGAFDLQLLDGVKATFTPNEQVDIGQWFEQRDKQNVEQTAQGVTETADKKYVEKGNKDVKFKYHIAKVEEALDYQDDEQITNEDFVIGVRPEFIKLTDKGDLKGEIYGAMPTGMESTIKIRVGDFLLT